MLNTATGITFALILTLISFWYSRNGKGPSAAAAGMVAYLVAIPLVVVLVVLVALRF